MALPRITVLISGRGSNLGALLAAERAGKLGGTVTTVISNRPEAAGLELATRHGAAATVVDHHRFATRDAFDAALGAAVDAAKADLVVRRVHAILGAGFVAAMPPMLNIHPSLLPATRLTPTAARSRRVRIQVAPCTSSPRSRLRPDRRAGGRPVHAGDDEEALAARVLAVEHRLLPAAVRAWCEGRLIIAGGHVRVTGEAIADGTLVVPAFAA